jgi:23S rRNA (uracil1939-C5)-methyltransferase
MNDDKQEPTPPEQPAPGQDSGILELDVEKLVTGGAGLARHDGQAVFCPLTAPGDRVRARVVEQRRGFVRAETVEILQPGPGRTEPPCPHFGQCGGCDLQHLTPAAQREAKTAIVAECFQRLGKLDVTDILQGPDAGGELGYRNRIRLHAHPAGPYGLHARGSHDVVPIESCPLILDQFNADILPWLRMLPPVDQIVVRLDGAGGWLLALFGQPARLKPLKRMLGSTPEGQAPAPGCVGILFNNRPVWGRDHLIVAVAGHKFRVGAQGFFQGNLAVTEDAVATVRGWLGELQGTGRLGTLLGDLYCGVGLFTLTLADLFERVVAVEMDPGACRDAENNIRRDAAAAAKATVHEGPAAVVLGELDGVDDAQWRGAAVVVDPPRTGLGKEGVAALVARAPRHVVYMSCDPATMARDCAALVAAGYRLDKLKALEMFPQTAHIECLGLLERTAD